MIDPFVLLTPILLLAVLALLGFVGCNQVYGIHDTTLASDITWRQSAEGIEQILNIDSVTTDPFGVAVEAGNLIVVWIWYNSSVERVSTQADPGGPGVTDSGGNSYQRAVGPTGGINSLANWRQEIWYATITNGGPDLVVRATFTGTFSGKKVISAQEYTGADQNSPFEAAAFSSGHATIATCGPVSATSHGLIVLGAVWQVRGKPETGFFRRSSQDGNVLEDRLVTDADSGQVTATSVAVDTPPQPPHQPPQQPQDWIAQVATFKGATSM
jgi:hypothetical protein